MGDKKANKVHFTCPHTVQTPFPVVCSWAGIVCLFTPNFFFQQYIYPYNYQGRNEAKYNRNFPRLINSVKLALSCIWKTSVEFLSPHVKCLCFNQWETRGRQVCCKYLCTCQHKHQKTDAFQRVHDGKHSKKLMWPPFIIHLLNDWFCSPFYKCLCHLKAI